MCSNEVLKERIDNMEKQNNKEHKEIKEGFSIVSKKIDEMMEKMENKFVMRKEFKVAVGLLSAFATILGIIGFFINK